MKYISSLTALEFLKSEKIFARYLLEILACVEKIQIIPDYPHGTLKTQLFPQSSHLLRMTGNNMCSGELHGKPLSNWFSTETMKMKGTKQSL